MSEILVVYSSRGGNTKQLAEALAGGAEEAGAQVTVKAASETSMEDLIAAAGIAFGSPVYFGDMSAELKNLIDESVAIRGKLAGKVGTAFCTSGHPTGGKETTMLSILQAMLIRGMVVMGDPIDAGGHYGVGCVGAPNDKVLDAAKKQGAYLAQVSRWSQS